VSRPVDGLDPEGGIHSDPQHDQQVSLSRSACPEPEEELRIRPDARGMGDTSPTRQLLTSPPALRTTSKIRTDSPAAMRG